MARVYGWGTRAQPRRDGCEMSAAVVDLAQAQVREIRGH